MHLACTTTASFSTHANAYSVLVGVGKVPLVNYLCNLVLHSVPLKHHVHCIYTCSHADVFKKNRLLVVVTYFDDYYKALLESYDEDEEIILKSDDVKKKVKDVVQRATEGACDIPDENVVPICGQWALYSKQLHHQPENTKLQHYVEKFLSMYEGPTTKGPDIATELEEASGIRMAEERYECVLPIDHIIRVHIIITTVYKINTACLCVFSTSQD